MYGFLAPNRQSLSKENAKIFKKFYCGQCCASQKYFGYASRTLVSYDATFIGLLLAAQNQKWKQESRGWCAVFPYKQKIYSPDELPQIVSACVSILLKEIKIKDALQEKESRIERFSHKYWSKKIFQAKQIFQSLGFPIDALIEKTLDSQKRLESKTNRQFTDYAIPSATFIAELFRSTAILSGLKENESILYDIGYHVGKIIYIVDSCIDIKDDFEKNQFNALIAADFDDYFFENRFKNMLHSTVVESFVKIRHGLKQLALCEHQEFVENILLQGFPKELSKRIDNKRQVVNSIKISKIKLVSEAALISAICFLLESNAEAAGFVWGKLDRGIYQYGCSLLNEKAVGIECLINPFVYYIPIRPNRGDTMQRPFCWFIFQVPKVIFVLSYTGPILWEEIKSIWKTLRKKRWESLFQKGSIEIYQKIYKKTESKDEWWHERSNLAIQIFNAIEIKDYFRAYNIVEKQSSYELSMMKEFKELKFQSDTSIKQANNLLFKIGIENYQRIVDLTTPYKGIEKLDKLNDLANKAIVIIQAIDNNTYNKAYEIVREDNRLSHMKEFIALKSKWQTILTKTKELFPHGGEKKYQQIETLMYPFAKTHELKNEPEWWTQRAENASKIISFIKNKQYGQAYKLVHDNPDLKLIETIEFKKIQQFREKVIAKCETLFKQFKKENWQKIIKYMKSFLGSPNYDGKPEWWTERAKCRINIYNYIQTKDYGRMYSVLIENDPKYQLRELPEITSIIQSYPPFMKQAQKQNPFNFLMLKMWHFSHADPLSLKEFQNALEDYGKKHFSYGIQTIDALLAQAMVHQRAKAGTLQTLNQPLQKWIDTYCNKNNISECTRLCEGFKKLKCFDLERKLLESMVAAYIATDAQVKRLQSLQTGRHKPEVKTKTTKADLHFDMAAVNWSADQIKTFFETLAREDKTLNHGLVITRWQKNIQLSKDMWNLSQAETILSTAVTEQLGDMADFILVNAALMTPRGDRSKTGWLLKPSGVPPYDFIEIGLLIFGDVLGNGLNLQVYSVYLPDNELPSGNITELNKATSNLVIAVKNEEDPDVNGFVEAGREIILQALAGWLHTAKAQTANSDSEGNEDDSIF